MADLTSKIKFQKKAKILIKTLLKIKYVRLQLHIFSQIYVWLYTYVMYLNI